GDVLTVPDPGLRPTHLIDTQLAFADREPEHGDRVQIHHGTRETPARLAWLGGRFWQLRLEQPLVPAPGDRLVVRQIAPPDTLGGGRVLEAHPKKHGPSRELLADLERRARGELTHEPSEVVGERLRKTRVRRFEEAARQPPPKPLSESAHQLEQRLRDGGLEPPLDSELDPDDLAALREAGSAIRVSRNLHYHRDALAQARERIIALAGRHGGAITLATLRDELGTSRKFAQALLEHFDSEKLTVRRGDEHVLRKPPRGL
ncbi:MAG TPA: SelB C-terminal domain-containing protein, partial [Solirubrobacteraceae bacterium]